MCPWYSTCQRLNRFSWNSVQHFFLLQNVVQHVRVSWKSAHWQPFFTEKHDCIYVRTSHIACQIWVKCDTEGLYVIQFSSGECRENMYRSKWNVSLFPAISCRSEQYYVSKSISADVNFVKNRRHEWYTLVTGTVQFGWNSVLRYRYTNQPSIRYFRTT